MPCSTYTNLANRAAIKDNVHGLSSPRRSPRVLIDWHTHIHSPANQAKPYWQGRCPMTLDNVLAAHALVGLDRSVISNTGHFLRFCTTVAGTVAGLEDCNRYLAQCPDHHPDKLGAMATCVSG